MQQLFGAAYGERRCASVPLSRRSASDWEGEGNDRRSWGEVLRARGAEGLTSAAHGEQRCASLPLSRRTASDWEGEGNVRRSWGEALGTSGSSVHRFNSFLLVLTLNNLTPGARHRPLSRAVAALVERGVQSAQVQQPVGAAPCE